MTMWRLLVVGSAFLVYIPVAGFVNSFGVFVERFDEVFCRPDDCLEMLVPAAALIAKVLIVEPLVILKHAQAASPGLISALALANFRLLCWFSVSLEAMVPNAVLFLIGFFLCVLSMFTTAQVNNLFSLLITHSVLYGFGSTLMLNTPMSLIESYFPKAHVRHVLATSIINLGPPIGVIIMNPLAVYLDMHEVHDWRDTMRVFGGAIAVAGILYLIITGLAHVYIGDSRTDGYIDMDADSSEKSSKKHKCSGVLGYLTHHANPAEEMNLCSSTDEWCNWRTLMWTTAIFLISVALFIPKTHFIRFMTNMGIAEERAALLMSFSGLSEAATSLIISFTGDLMGVHIVGVYMLSSFVLCVGNILLVFAYTEGQCAIYVAIHGAVDGLLMTVLFSVTGHLDQRHNMALWAISNFAIGVGQIAGLPVAGVLYDSFHSYGPAFIMSSCVFGIASILFGIIYSWSYKHKKKEPEKMAILPKDEDILSDTKPPMIHEGPDNVD